MNSTRKPTSPAKHDLVVPALTPFNADQSLNLDALRGHVDYVIEQCRATMVVAAGVEAQEYHYLSLDQRKLLVQKTIEAVDGRVPVVVGISHASYRTAIELGRFAAAEGASVIQILAPLRPFGGVPTTQEVVKYFELIAGETELPIMLYLNAGPGADLSVDATKELAKLERVKYLKESSRDLSRVGRLIKEIDAAGHARYLTTAQMLLISLQLGGSGATMPPPLAELGGKIIAAVAAGDAVEAARLQQQIALYPARWMHRGLTPTMKASLSFLGRDIGQPYPPFGEFTTAEIQGLQDYLKTTDLTPLNSH